MYITFHVEPDARFQRDGDDLITQVGISYTQAVLGGSTKVPTLTGEIDLDIDAGTQPGTLRVLRGRGIPNVQGRGKGDLVVRFTIAVPRKISDDQRKLIEDLGKLDPPPPTAAAEAEPDKTASDDGFSFFRKSKKKKR